MDEIQASRRIYNSNVQSYNTKIQQFPTSIVANQGNFEDKESLHHPPEAEGIDPSPLTENTVQVLWLQS